MPSVPDPANVKPWYLRNITEALALDEPTGNVYVRTGFTGNIIISGNVNIPGNVQVYSTPQDPVHTHITEVGTSNILDVPYLPIGGNVIVTSGNVNANVSGNVGIIGNVNVTQGTDPWNITGNIIVSSGNVNSNVSGNVGILGNVNANVSGTVVVSSGNVTVSGNVNVDHLPSITGNVNANVTGGNINANVTQGTSPWVISGNVNSNVTGGNIISTLPDTAVTAFDEPLAVGITPIIQADSIYGLDPDFWITTQLNNGNITLANSTWQVNSGTSAGGYARLATSKYMTYQPGQGAMFRWTAAFTTTNDANTKAAFGIDNIVQNTGPIDREDGYSFGYSGAADNDTHRKIGILHRRGGKTETRALTITVAPTGAQTAVVTLNSISYTISLTASTSVFYTASQIANALKAIDTANNLWDIEGCNGIVTFTSYSPGAKSGTYSFSSSGTGTIAVAGFTTIQAGVSPIDVWTYVDQWDNQTIQFDPTKLNVYAVDMRWLGAGRVRFFMEDPSTGKFVLVHTQKWSSQYTVPHITKPSLRIAYRSGTTNPAVTPSRNVVVTGASVMSGIQGIINQTGSSQGWFNIDSTTRAKDKVYHLMSIQNPFVRSNTVNKASLALQTLTISVQGNDPSVIYVVKNAIGLSDVLVFQSLPNQTTHMFAQYSVSVVTENLNVDRVCNVQTLGINGNATFDLASYNLNIAAGETVSVFISSSNAINRTAIGLTWNVD